VLGADEKILRCAIGAVAATKILGIADTLLTRDTVMKSSIARLPAPPAANKKAYPFDLKSFVAQYGGTIGSKFKSKQIVYSQGTLADCIFYIVKGRARVTVISKQGKEAVIAVLEPGDFFGEDTLVGESLRMSTVTTVTECTIARLQKTSVIRAIHENLEFSEFFIMYILNRSIQMRDSLIDHLFNSSERRLARILLLLSNYGKEGRTETVMIHLDQKTLAQMVGTTRSRVNFFMNKFRKLGYIDYNGGINVHSSLLTVILHDPPIGAIEIPEPMEL
jgi:CRP/FNR family transcriptional regulator, cyclic AMP receptor protein